mmetsp:Transcript_53937/g.125878  ORF Transcript_53937/g.125878 Transcript_53937/m.125878 type:complete len:127 (-) Transcript_53937:426-806(-)
MRQLVMAVEARTPVPPSEPRVHRAAPCRRFPQGFQRQHSSPEKRVSFGPTEVVEVCYLCTEERRSQETCRNVEPELSGLAQLSAMRERRLAEEPRRTMLISAITWARVSENQDGNTVIDLSLFGVQ